MLRGLRAEKATRFADFLRWDMAPDYDDVGAMAVLHALADSGEVDILATVSSNKQETTAPCIDVCNTYFGRPGIPVGAPKGEGVSMDTWHKGLKRTEELPSRFPHKVESASQAEDAVSVYRRVLNAQPDTSVVVVTVGFFTNLKDLLESGPDADSPLSGKELVAAEVKRLVSMAGYFPEGKEFNVMMDAPASQYVFENWPTPIVLSGFDIGEKIITGKQTAAMPVEGSPVREAYKMCLEQDNPEGRNSWDQSAVLVAVRGAEPYFGLKLARLRSRRPTATITGRPIRPADTRAAAAENADRTGYGYDRSIDDASAHGTEITFASRSGRNFCRRRTFYGKQPTEWKP